MRIFDGFLEITAFCTDKNHGNFADYVGEDANTLEKRRVEFAKTQKIVLLKQVHGDIVLEVDSGKIEPNGAFYFGGEADGMITNEAGVTLAIQTADCAGVLLYDETNKAIAALHAGRKGAELNILGKCVAKMQDLYGTKPDKLAVYIGVHIRGCCYELPADMAKEFDKYENAVEKRDGKHYLDIAKVILSQARSLGIKDENIEISPSCTSCESDKYFSYRAEDGKCGRMLTAIGLKAI
ncbi:MAG: peptidoglycan editing factor PgeF [Campylobacterales bacterium]